ncbi:unnamed protein product, partial [Closterium sp. NIES-53]
EDLVSHLRASDARYRAALPAEFLDKNPPPMDHFVFLDPTSLTIDLLKQHHLASETSAVASVFRSWPLASAATECTAHPVVCSTFAASPPLCCRGSVALLSRPRRPS